MGGGSARVKKVSDQAANSSAGMRRVPISAASADPDRHVVCGCIDLTLTQLRQMVADGCAFDDLLTNTGAGSVCTSCVMDLEYYFQTTPHTVSKREGVKVGEVARRSVKRRLFDWLDDISPPVPFRRRQIAPVIYGPGLEQWLTIANQPMLIRESTEPPTLEYVLTLRDSAGKQHATTRDSIPLGKTLRLNLTELSNSAEDACRAASNDPNGLSVGSFEVVCKWATPGVRGTTRPQIQLSGTGGSSSVHTVGPSGAPEHWVSCLSRPDAERVFISCVNASKKDLTVDVNYPVGVSGCTPTEHHVSVKAQGAGLFEVRLRPEQANAVGELPFPLRLSGRGLKMVHYLSASPELERVSLDHI